jgi:hypothetical protein
LTGHAADFAAKIAGRGQWMIKMSAIAYEQGSPLRRRSMPARQRAAAAAAFVLAAAGLAPAAEAQHGQTTIACSNPASGTTWRITIDFDRRTVDGQPASINDATISWRDPGDQGNYTLDRKSGNLRVAVPSSTGGYFLHDRCKLDK